MKTDIFVISDLHLGGEPGLNDAPGFRILTAAGQQRLAQFLAWVGRQASGDPRVELVIDGDFVDFLAEREFAVFTTDDDTAAGKLEHVMGGTAAVGTACGPPFPPACG